MLNSELGKAGAACLYHNRCLFCGGYAIGREGREGFVNHLYALPDQLHP